MKFQIRHYPTRLPLAATALLLVLACSPTAANPPATAVSAPTAPASKPTAEGASASKEPPGPTVTSANPDAAAFDQQFIDMMVPHHEGAVEMAKIAQQRAQHPEIKQLGEDILRSQEAEISHMRQWRQAWYGSSTTPPMSQMPMLSDGVSGMGSMGGMHSGRTTMDMSADVERLRSASEPFDVAFIDAMIPHHESAIEAGRVALKQSARPEIQGLAAGIIEAQQKEIGQMQTWRLAWFATPTAPSGTP